MKTNILIISFIFLLPNFIFSQYSKESYRPFMKAPISLKSINCGKSTLQADSPEELERIEIGKSGNVISIQGSEQRPLYFDPSSQTMLFTFTADTEEYPNANSKGSIISAYCQNDNDSYDEPYFYNWQETLTINPDINNHFIKNPSAVLINPDDSEDIDDLYTVIIAEDSTNGAWSKTIFASCKLNGDEYHESYYDWENENDKASSSMTVVGNDIYIFGQKFDNINEHGVNQELKHYKGTSDDPANGYSWEVNAISPVWLIDPVDGFAYALYNTWSAWSKSENIGYMWMVGVTNESYEYGVYQPQVYYTNDHGDNWTPIELNLEDHPLLANYLPPCEDENGNPTVVRPSFVSGDNNFPGAVDGFGNLHLLSNVYGSTKGDVLNPEDSLWIDEEAKGGHVFDFIISPTGIENIEFVTEFKTKTNTGELEEFRYDHRLQVGQENWYDVIAAVWTDDVFSETDFMTHPSVYSWNICSGALPADIVYNTEEDLYDGYYFFPFIAENIIFHDWGRINIPLTSSVDPTEYLNNRPDKAATHSYTNGINSWIRDECIWGLSDGLLIEKELKVYQNNPNPFSDKTSIVISSNFQFPTKISFELFDVMGNEIYRDDSKVITDYLEIELNTDLLNLKHGAYFYRVQFEDQSITKKMMVK